MAAVVALLVLVISGVLIGANTETGRAFLTRTVASLTGDTVRIEGLAGRFPQDFSVAHVALSDAKGAWLTIDNFALTWSPRALLDRIVSVENISAAHVVVTRLPDGESSSSGGSSALPLPVTVRRLHVDKFDLAEPVAGFAASFSVDGEAALPSATAGNAALTLQRLDLPGLYRVVAHQDTDGLRATVKAEQDQLVAALAGEPALAPTALDATLDGPLNALATKLTLTAGQMKASGDGTINVPGEAAHLLLTIDDLAPFAKLGGLDLQGATKLTVDAALKGSTTEAHVTGTLSLTGGPAPAPVLIGNDARIKTAVSLHGETIELQKFSLTGAAITATANGTLVGKKLDAAWTLGLSDLHLIAPQIVGNVEATGHAVGTLADLAADADLSGTLTPPGVHGGPFSAQLRATHLPDNPAATLRATGELAAAPLDLDIEAARQDGTLRTTIRRATWRSVAADGDMQLPPGATLPLGKVVVKIGQLGDLSPFVGQRLNGALDATLDATAQRATLQANGRNITVPGTASVAGLKATADIPDPAHPVAGIKIAADGLRIGTVPDAIRLTTDATLDMPHQRLAVASFQAVRGRDTARLLSPATIDFADGLRVDRLRLGLRQAVLEAAGRLSPTLDLTASLRGTIADLTSPVMPDSPADGTVSAEARLTGEPARPAGTVRLTVDGLRPRPGDARALPPARLAATAKLAGGRADIDARLTAGSAAMSVTGAAPLGDGRLALTASGNADLALLEPLVSGAGRRVGGQLSLRASIGGTTAAPVIDGTVAVARGTFQDFSSGLNLTDITANLRGAGDTLRVDRLTATAGPGRIDATGSIGVMAAGMPIDLTMTARNARPVSNDTLSATLDADLTLRGAALNDAVLGGQIKIQRADIRVPERLPASIPVLQVIRPGVKPPPPPAPPPAIGLALTLDAPGQVFVRGRGLDAELGGRIKVGGTLANPQPQGHFSLVRGTFSVAGQTVTFSKGQVGFDGGSLTDPSLNFLVTRYGTVEANLAITGTAKAPKITLSSSPPLPQDEVLSQLLLGKSASQLQPLELAQIAAALASLTGAGPGIGDPLNDIRNELGLDRLSIGNNGTGSSLDAGRYVAPGIYLGARQSLSGSGTQSVVQFDITRSLKLEGTVGTGTASATGNEASQGTGVSVIYQKDY